MSNIVPITPSYTLSYWKPWKENSNLFDSWTNYIKDVSLAKYTADTIGQYIEESSKNQILALNSIGEKLGENLSDISTKIDISNELLSNLNRNLNFLIEQQKVTNLLLGDISKLLRIPDSEKERQHKIELGLKFFANAKIDNDLFHDALEQLLFAESMYKQDYFVLYRIGLIYLYAPSLFDVEKAIDYFKRAAKYSIVETDKKSSTLFNILNKKFVKKETEEKEIFIYKVTVDSKKYSFGGSFLIELFNYLDNGYNKKILGIDTKDYSYPISFIIQFNDKPNFEDFYDDMQRLSFFKEDFKFEKIDDSISLEDSIKIISAESYDKIAFSYYLKGDFINAVAFQDRCIQLDNSISNRVNLAKYQIRNNQITAALENIEIVLRSDWEFLLFFFSDLDFIGCEEITKYLDNIQIRLNSEFLELANKIDKKNKSIKKIDEIEFGNFSLSKKIYCLAEYKSILKNIEFDEKEYLVKIVFDEKRKQITIILDLITKITLIFERHIRDRHVQSIYQINHSDKNCPNKLISRQYDGLHCIDPFNRKGSRIGNMFIATKSNYFVEVFHYLIFQKDGYFQTTYSAVKVAVDYFENGKTFNENDINDIRMIVRSILEIESKGPDWQHPNSGIDKTVPFMVNRIDFIVNNIGNNDLFSKKNNSSCFVATATLGDFNHPIVKDLRQFRDQYLIKSEWGKKFTQWYYVYGKIAASYIVNSKTLQLLSFVFLIKPLHLLIKNFFIKSKW